MAGLLTRLATMARRTLAPEPEPSYTIRVGAATSGVSVHNEESALSFTGVWACCKVIAETLAGLPWHACRKSPDGERWQMDTHPITTLLNVRPNPETPAFIWRERMTIWAALWGDAYAEIERDQLGRPVALWQIEPHRVYLERDENRRLWYRIWNRGRDDTFLAPDDMYHVRGLGPSGLCGYYVVALFRESIALGLATEQQAAAYFGNAAQPSGVLMHPGRIDPEKARELIETFELRHKGPSKRAKIGILQGGLDYKPLGHSAEDSQLEKTRTFQILEACRIFRVPPHKIAELSRATFSNISEQETSFGRDCLTPWAKRFEQEADGKLFPPRPIPLFYTRMNVNAIMRGDPKGRAEYYEIMERIGALTVNEIRALEELNMIGPDGDKHLIPANFTTLEKIGQDPPPPAPPAAPPATDGDDGDGMDDVDGGDGNQLPDDPGRAEDLARANRAVRGLVRDLTAWLARRARGEVGAAAKRFQMAGIPVSASPGFGQWCAEYTPATADLLAGRLRPLIAAWCELAELPPAWTTEAAARIGYAMAVAVQNTAAPAVVPWAETHLDALGPAWAQRLTDWIMADLNQLTRETVSNG